MWAQTHHDALRCYELLFAPAVKVGIQFKPTKCTVFAKTLQVLGHTITEHGRVLKQLPAWNHLQMPPALRGSWVSATSFATTFQTCRLAPSTFVSH